MRKPYLVFSLLALVILAAFFGLVVVDATVIQSAAAAIDSCADCRLPVMQLAQWSLCKGALCGAVLTLLFSFTPPDASGTAAGRTPAASTKENN